MSLAITSAIGSLLLAARTAVLVRQGSVDSAVFAGFVTLFFLLLTLDLFRELRR